MAGKKASEGHPDRWLELVADRVLHLLERGDLASRWEAGKAINRALGDRAGYGGSEVEKLASELGVSAAVLACYRRLARLWSPVDIKRAGRHGLPFRAALRILALDTIGDRCGAASGRGWGAKLERTRRRLIDAYPDSNASKQTLRQWHLKVTHEVIAARSRLGKAHSRRSLKDLERGFLGDLDRAATRLQQPGSVWPFGMHGEVNRLRDDIAKLRSRAVGVFQKGVEVDQLLRDR